MGGIVSRVPVSVTVRVPVTVTVRVPVSVRADELTSAFAPTRTPNRTTAALLGLTAGRFRVAFRHEDRVSADLDEDSKRGTFPPLTDLASSKVHPKLSR